MNCDSSKPNLSHDCCSLHMDKFMYAQNAISDFGVVHLRETTTFPDLPKSDTGIFSD